MCHTPRDRKRTWMCENKNALTDAERKKKNEVMFLMIVIAVLNCVCTCLRKKLLLRLLLLRLRIRLLTSQIKIVDLIDFITTGCLLWTFIFIFIFISEMGKSVIFLLKSSQVKSSHILKIFKSQSSQVIF